jgi:NADH-quinone oxidoreductase subunit C
MSDTEPTAPVAPAPPSKVEQLALDAAQALGTLLVGAPMIAYGEVTLRVAAGNVVAALTQLRDGAGLNFSQLIDLTAVDYPERVTRFEVIYHLLSLSRNERIRVRIAIEEDGVVPSAIAAYPAANWFEREVFDMFGIPFLDHPDLRRILTDYGFEGHPLRKDFPMTGHVEVRYDMELRRVVYEPVKLTQDFRSFDFMSPWEGAPYILPGDEKARSQG